VRNYSIAKKAAISGRLCSDCPACEAALNALDVLCLPAFRPFNYVKLYLLTFLEAAESTGLNGGEMYEDILTVLAADETVPLGVVEPLHCSCFHVMLCSFT